MSVRVGSARSNENGGINGGAAGDQTGSEVSTQTWYLHSKGWVVLRAKDTSIREKIAHNMESICANDNIGYCQDHRATLTTAAKPYGYDASKVAQKVEVDCSEAVRNCLLYAGITIGSFSTETEVFVLVSTGKFERLSEDKYCKSSDYLLRGDILVTKTKGHTVVVLDNGAKADDKPPAQSTGSDKVYIVQKGDTLSKIAAKYGTTYQKLAEYNGITNPSVITVGQKIKIPGAGAQGSSGNPEKTYKVKGGDSLWTIAAKELGNGNRYKEIKSLNGLKNDTIYPGQVLKLPN